MFVLVAILQKSSYTLSDVTSRADARGVPRADGKFTSPASANG